MQININQSAVLIADASHRSSRRSPTAWRAVAALAAIGVGYHYSLQTLARNLGVQTPLAYLGLVPVIAVLIGCSRAAPAATEPDVADRQFDYIVGVPLIAGALLMVTVLPDRLSTMFWVWRVDLLSLPLFAAGIVAITFGARALWRLRTAVLFLALAWPLPYTWLLGHLLDTVTDATIATVRWWLRFVDVATPIPGQSSMFEIRHGVDTFQLNVASSCAGVNGVLGFLLLGLAFAIVVRGRRWHKTLWLAGGMGVMWLLNAGRILLLFVVAHRYGEDTAIKAFHPYVGLVAFNLGAFVMVLAMPVFRLRFGRPAALPRREGSATLARAVPRFRLALLVIAVSSAALAVANARFTAYELVAGDLGAPRLQSFLVQPPVPEGWTIAEVDSYPWGRQYFGEDSTWVRFRYTHRATPAALPIPTPARTKTAAEVAPTTRGKTLDPLTRGKTPAPLAPAGHRSAASGGAGRAAPPPADEITTPIYADVVTTAELSSFSTYGITQCYRFHGYELHSEDTADLGGGIRATVVRYTNTKLGNDWTSVSWILPVHTPDGTRYERVTLMTRVPSEQEDAAVVSARPDQLVAFAREVVALEATASDVGAPAPSNAKATSKPQTKATTKPKTTNVLVPSTTIPPTTPAPTPLTPRPALPKKGGK